MNPLTLWCYLNLNAFILICDLPFIDVMWPSAHSTWRSSAGPTPGPHGQALRYPAWTSTASAEQQMFLRAQRNFLQPPPNAQQYHQTPTPPSNPSLSFGLPLPERTPVLQQATQMFSDVLRQFTARPTLFSSPTPTPEPTSASPPTPSPCPMASPPGPPPASTPPPPPIPPMPNLLP